MGGMFMKLIGNLKKKVENAKTKEEARDTIKKAGMLLDDDELEQVSGGGDNPLEDLLNPGFQEGDKVRYLGNNKIYYGQYGTIWKIKNQRFIWYRVLFEKRGLLDCTASDLQKA
jgi:hypothetical protein